MSLTGSACFDPAPLDEASTQTSGDASGPSTTGAQSTSVPETTTGSADDSTDRPPGTCGDGAIDSGEACDDANTNDGDGCSADCQEEPGFNCTGQPSTCTSMCGDGEIASTETCDDGNAEPGDGCSARCTPEPGFDCQGEPSMCTSTCGDGRLAPDEDCDDGNRTDGDGCTQCAIDPGHACQGEPSACTPLCGDGMLVADERCDDGNSMDGDGCSADCTIELYSRCVGAGPGSCAPIRILYAPALEDDAVFRTATSSITGGPVDHLDATFNTPTLAMLEADYDCVITHSGFDYADSPLLSSTMVDFVDAGGNVVLGFAANYDPPLGFGGTPIMTPNYSPISAAAAADFDIHTYANDGTTLIHQDVVTYVSQIADSGVILQGMGVQASTYQDGRIAVAHRPDFKVVYINGAGHSAWAEASGDWPRLVANSCAVGFVESP